MPSPHTSSSHTLTHPPPRPHTSEPAGACLPSPALWHCDASSSSNLLTPPPPPYISSCKLLLLFTPPPPHTSSLHIKARCQQVLLVDVRDTVVTQANGRTQDVVGDGKGVDQGQGHAPQLRAKLNNEPLDGLGLGGGNVLVIPVGSVFFVVCVFTYAGVLWWCLCCGAFVHQRRCV